MDPPKFVFYISHFPADDAASRILKTCVDGIMKYYPGYPIRIMASPSSNPVRLDVSSSDITIETSPLPNSSVVGGFKHFLQNDYDKAVFLHDSMIIKGRFDDNIERDFGYLWYFRHISDLETIECHDIRVRMNDFVGSRDPFKWVGCFGCALFSTRKALMQLWDAVDFPYYATHSNRAKALMDLERVIGIVSAGIGLYNPEKHVTLCGSIFDLPYAFHRTYVSQTLSDVERIVYNKPIYKFWMQRFLR